MGSQDCTRRFARSWIYANQDLYLWLLKFSNRHSYRSALVYLHPTGCNVSLGEQVRNLVILEFDQALQESMRICVTVPCPG